MDTPTAAIRTRPRIQTTRRYPDCLADFLDTIDGGTLVPEIPAGLKNFVEWTDPSPTNPLKKGYDCTTWASYAPAYQAGGALDISTVTHEIDAGRPVMLTVYAYGAGGHSIACYGYQPNMFEIRVQVVNDYENELTYGVAVHDTWATGTSDTGWHDWSGGTISSYIDGNGVEWWPSVPYTAYSENGAAV